MNVLIFVLSLLYAFLMALLTYGLLRLPRTEIQKSAALSFSLIIPYRNEAAALPLLLKSLKQLNYPADFFEIILVNDGSQDHSRKICQGFKTNNPHLNIVLENNSRKTASPKKDAILTGLRLAQHQYILTTDADCVVPVEWLYALSSEFNTSGAKMVAGPVMIEDKPGLLSRYQKLDFLSLQGATMGSFGMGYPLMCNGANLCYEKNSFSRVNGYEGNTSIGGGDDVFLLEKFLEQDIPVSYVRSRNALVITSSQVTLAKLLNQRIRWAAKASALSSWPSRISGSLVLMMNLSVMLILTTALFGNSIGALVWVLVSKILSDYILVAIASRFFEDRIRLLQFLWGSLVYPFFTTIIAICCMGGSYSWKGRKYVKQGST